MKQLGWLVFWAVLFLIVRFFALPKGNDTDTEQIPFATLLEKPAMYAGRIIETKVYVCRCEFILFRSFIFVSENNNCERTIILLSNNTFSSNQYITLKTKLILLQYSSDRHNHYFLKETKK